MRRITGSYIQPAGQHERYNSGLILVPADKRGEDWCDAGCSGFAPMRSAGRGSGDSPPGYGLLSRH